MKPGCSLIAAVLIGAVSLVIWSSALARPEIVKAKGGMKVMDLMDRANPPPFRPDRIAVEFPEGGIEGLTVPEGLSDVRLGRFELAGKSLAVVVAKSSEGAKGPDLVGIDSDSDGSLSDAERFTLTVNERPARGGGTTVNGVNPKILLAIDGHDFSGLFVCTVAGSTFRAQFTPTSYLEARFTSGEKEYVVSLMDRDLDGEFSGEKDLWLLEQAGPRSRPASAFGLSGLSEGRFLDGRDFRLEKVEGTTLRISSEAAEAPNPEDLKAQRERAEHIWFERFDKEREGFVKARGLDTSRPLAEKPIEWLYVTMAEAKAMAEKEGKLLFVDVMGLWCVWCYRMDYYTYADAEVAALLTEKFIPMKIVQEHDLVGDYERVKDELGARGIPAMGIWSPDGKLLKKIGGWKKPEDFLEQLAEGISALSGGK